MNQVITNAIEKVFTSFPSIYSKQDVIDLLTSLEFPEQENQSVDIDKLRDLITDKLTDAVNNLRSDDIVDYGSVEFSIGYENKIELDSIDVNVDTITDEFENVVEKVLTEYFKDSE
jgi:hypothetical protein